MTVKELFVSLGITKDERSFSNAEASIKKFAGTATKLLGALGIALSLKSMNALAEQFNNINDSIRDATKNMGDQREIQRQIMNAANDTKLSYESMGRNVTQLIKMNEKLFDSVESASSFASQFTKNLAAAGKGEGEISSAMSMLNRTLARGTLDTMAYERMLRSYPEVINAIAEGMGVSKEQLKKLAESGKITSDTIVKAYSNASASIQSRFDELDYSISDAMLNIRNKWGYFCDELWTGSNITNGVGKMMVQTFDKLLAVLKKLQPYIERFIKWFLGKTQRLIDFFIKVLDFGEKLVKRFGGFENLAKSIGIAIGAAMAVINLPKIINSLKTIASLLKGPVLLAVLLGLAIEDFMQFMKGNNSILGEIFAKFGVNAEDVKAKVIAVWEKIKAFLAKTWEVIKKIASAVFDGLKAFWAKHGDSIVNMFKSYWNACKAVFGAIVKVVQAIISKIAAFIEEHKDTITAVIDEIVNIVTIAFTMIGNLVEPLIKYLTSLMDFITDVFSGNWEAAWEDIKNIFSSVYDGFKVIIDAIDEMFGDLISSALDWGKDIIQNIVDGIMAGVDWVKDAVKNVGETISSFLHFSEPDEGPLSNFHTWMPDMMKGLAVGINDNQGVVLNGIKKLAGGISTLMKDATASASMFGSRNSNVTQNVTFNNSYSGNQMDAVKNVAKATKQSAIDATTLMARSLSLAR